MVHNNLYTLPLKVVYVQAMYEMILATKKRKKGEQMWHVFFIHIDFY